MIIVLYSPQIPQNTGNIVRTCAVTGCELVLVRPLGFSTSDRWLKRSGLDYWEGVNVKIIDHLDEWLELHQQKRCNFYFVENYTQKLYTQISYNSTDALIFGSETTGIPKSYYEKYPENFVALPMLPGQRSLNLSNAVAVSVYEAWRQQNFQIKT